MLGLLLLLVTMLELQLLRGLVLQPLLLCCFLWVVAATPWTPANSAWAAATASVALAAANAGRAAEASGSWLLLRLPLGLYRLLGL